MNAESLPLKQRLHRWKVRMRRRADSVAFGVLVVLSLPAIVIVLAMMFFGYDFENDWQGFAGEVDSLRIPPP